ncbi:MAG: DMT family transporter [Bacteroidales bacterium]|nr:DMT family transporter [Bacteroidales bacterium]
MTKSQANSLMLFTAMIWGFAFVAQRAGMEHLGPFAFTSIRFALGSISLILVAYIISRIQKKSFIFEKKIFIHAAMAGSVLFLGAVFQQWGLVYTTAGKGGFITGLYVIFVPILGIFSGYKTGPRVWAGIILALVGMYLLSIKSGFTVEIGDLLILFSAFFWALHLIIIAKISPLYDSFKISSLQFAVVAILSGIITIFAEAEQTTTQNIYNAGIPILYGGLVSVGIAYTLQVVAQKHAHPSYVSILLSFESVFAVIGGWLILNESFTVRDLSGCGLMLAGILVAQSADIMIPDADIK